MKIKTFTQWYQYINVIIYLVVIILYFVFYGWSLILRYQEGGVTIVRKDKNTENINPPGILTQDMINPDTIRKHKTKLKLSVNC